MTRRPLNRRARITGDAATHALYGVGPATDYGADVGEPIYATFTGHVSTWWSPPGGNTTRITHPTLDIRAFIQHQAGYTLNVNDRGCLEGEHIGYAGNTGTATDGPHVHSWAEVAGVRMTLEHFIALTGGTETPLGSRTPDTATTTAGAPPTEYPKDDMYNDDDRARDNATAATITRIYDALFTLERTSRGSSAGVLAVLGKLEEPIAATRSALFKTTQTSFGTPGGVLPTLKAITDHLGITAPETK